MPHHVFTRQALYDRVWAKPMRTVAAELGVSDVGLAKACRAAGVPTPPRGYWARKQHGKSLPPRPALPPRPNRPDRVVIAPAPPKPAPSEAVLTAADVAAQMPPIAVPEDLRGAHPLVRGWLAQAEARRREWRRLGWNTAQLEDLSAPLAQRRLRLTSALLKALAARKLELGEDQQWLTVGRGEDRVGFRLYERGRVEHRAATADELRWQPERKTVRATVPAGDLVLKVREWSDLPSEYKELRAPLEAQLATIVANLEAGVAEQARLRTARTEAAVRQAAADAERRKWAAYREAQEVLRQKLLAQAGRRAQAEAVRAYVAAADASAAAQGEDYAGWRAWALAEADALDPLKDGSTPFKRLAPIEDWTWRGW